MRELTFYSPIDFKTPIKKGSYIYKETSISINFKRTIINIYNYPHRI